MSHNAVGQQKRRAGRRSENPVRNGRLSLREIDKAMRTQGFIDDIGESPTISDRGGYTMPSGDENSDWGKY